MSLLAIDILQEAKLLLKQGWCQGAFARDSQGNPVPVMDSSAVSFDAAGAIARASISRNVRWQIAMVPFSEALKESIPKWQDHATLPEVLACIDETIATLRARGGFDFAG